MPKCTNCAHCGTKTNENCSFDGSVEKTNEFTGIVKKEIVFTGLKSKESLNGAGECPYFKTKGWRG